MQTITYIKEGKERKISRLNYALFGKGDIYSLEEDDRETIKYEVSKDVELLHLKNFKFANSVCFHLKNKDTILVLDACCFSNRFEIYNGSVSVNVPTYNNSSSNIYFHDNEYVELNLQDDTIKGGKPRPHTYWLSSGQELTMTGDASKSLVYIDKHISKITMQNLENPRLVWGKVEELRMLDTKIKTGFGYETNYKKIYMENSTLTVGGDAIDLSKTENLQIKDSTIQAPLIFLPNGKMRRGHNLEFSSTKDDTSGNLFSARLSLISCLKTIGEKSEIACDDKSKEISTEKDEKYLPTIDFHQKQIQRYAELIVEEESAIAKIEEERKNIENKIDGNLHKQKIKTILPTNKK